jgi:MinD-like ATPase involved in chromosome partitioning or flagellar assembly
VSLYAVASAKGSPGATVAASALASVWPTDPVLADLDPVGGDVAWRYRDLGGEPLEAERGLLSLGAGVRRGAAEVDLADHLQVASGGLRVLAGLSSPAQGAGIGSAWAQLPGVFSAADCDVIADCGRVVPGSATMPVLASADAVLFVVRPTIEGVAHLRDRLGLLRDPLRLGAPDGVAVGVAVVTGYRDTRSGPELQQLLDSEGLKARVLGVIVDDPRSAEMFRGGRYRSPARSLLVRSAVEIATRLQALPHMSLERVR